MTSFEGRVVSAISNAWNIILTSNKYAITGAASGMGLATAQLLASRGAVISLADVNEEGLRSAAASLGNGQQHMYTVVDVRNSEQVNSWIEATVSKYSKLDGAVNMAGIISKATPVRDLTDADWDFSFAVNTKGVFNCLRAQLNAMQDGGSIVRSMLIVFVSHSLTVAQVSAASVFGQFGAPGNAAYCSTKAAVIGLSRTAAKENQKIRVNCVSPGKSPDPFVEISAKS